MPWFTRAFNVLRPNRVSRDIEREMAFHMAERTDALIQNGMSETEATAEARRRFGRPTQLHESTRDADMLTWLESFANDLRQAARVLRASKGFTFVAVLSLALGIGANTAIFSLINAVMLKSLPVHDPASLVTISSPNFGSQLSNPVWEQFRDRQKVLAGAAVYNNYNFNLANGGEMRRVAGSWVSGDYFRMLGVNAAAGRLLTVADDARGCAGTAVLSYGFWQSEYGGKASAVGSAISLNSHPFTIIGVTPSAFFGAEVGTAPKVYAPMCAMAAIGNGDMLDEKHGWFLYLIARLQPEQTTERAEHELSQIGPAVWENALAAEQFANAKRDGVALTFDVKEGVGELSTLRQKYSTSLFALMAVVSIVLCIGCANVANLLMARAAARQREIAVRFALGASRARVIRQLLTETLLLTSLGAVAGVLFARWSTGLLVGLLSSGNNGVDLDVPIDARVLLFTTAIATFTGLLFGLAPAWKSTRTNPQEAMRANGRGIASGHSRFSIAKTLVIGQVALSLVLVVAAGLLLGTFHTLSTIDPGFDRNNVLLVSTNFSNAGFSDARLLDAFDELLQKLRTIPGVTSASASVMTPVEGGGWNGGIAVEGFVSKKRGDALVFLNEVTADYFTTMRTPFKIGRPFDDRDKRGGPKVAIINEATARKFFGNTNAVGRQFHMPSRKAEGPPYEVIGVVANSKYTNLREEPRTQLFLPKSQNENPDTHLNAELRYTGNARTITPQITALVNSMSPRITLQYRTLDDQVAASLSRERLLATLSAFFGALALLLAMIGLYGTMSYSVQRRRAEIGVRLALGAARDRVFRLVLREVSVLLVMGLALGTVGALAGSRFVTSFLFGVTPNDKATLALSILTLASVAIMAGAIPAWRAARLDPMLALRED